jgi:hypothetical protein
VSSKQTLAAGTPSREPLIMRALRFVCACDALRVHFLSVPTVSLLEKEFPAAALCLFKVCAKSLAKRFSRSQAHLLTTLEP